MTRHWVGMGHLPDAEDSLERVEGEPDGWHVRETVANEYPLMGSSPAERAEAEVRIARIKAQAMRTHPFEGDGPYCQARIPFAPMGSAGTRWAIITGWQECGYPLDTHPVVAG